MEPSSVGMRGYASLRLPLHRDFVARRHICTRRYTLPMVTSATDGQRARQPSVKSLQRQTKAWLQYELACRGIEAEGTKAELAKQLLAVLGEHTGAAAAASADMVAPTPTPAHTPSPAPANPQSNQMEKEGLMRLKVIDLKAKLSDLGLPKSGKKEELVDRLLASGAASGQPVFTEPKGSSASGTVSKPVELNTSTASEVPKRGPSDGSKAPAMRPKTKQARSSAEAASFLRSQVETLKKEIQLREDTLMDLSNKLEAAEQSQRVDRQMLAELQSTVVEIVEQQTVWQASVKQGKLKQLQDEVATIEDKLRPDLERQLAELQALADGLEKESSLKEDMVKQLTASLNRSFAAPSASKGLPGVSVAPAAQANVGVKKVAANKTSGLGGIGVALAAGVIAVLDGLSLRQTLSEDSVPEK